MNVKRQLSILGILVLIYALLVLSSTLTTPVDQLAPPGTLSDTAMEIPGWQIALASAGIVLVLYGLLGTAGFWFARKLELPGIYRVEAGWKAWFRQPLFLGLGFGVICVLIDRVITLAVSVEGLPYPEFPLSLLASASAGIGEEIMFRGFVFGLWALIFNLLLRRWEVKRKALWIANVIAEGLLINSIVGIVAGERYMKDGLVAAMGVHFWTDVVWHVIWPVLNTMA
jgi:membrane protease YdiL (CAAX protease family)